MGWLPDYRTVYTVNVIPPCFVQMSMASVYLDGNISLKNAYFLPCTSSRSSSSVVFISSINSYVYGSVAEENFLLILASLWEAAISTGTLVPGLVGKVGKQLLPLFLFLH